MEPGHGDEDVALRHYPPARMTGAPHRSECPVHLPTSVGVSMNPDPGLPTVHPARIYDPCPGRPQGAAR